MMMLALSFGLSFGLSSTAALTLKSGQVIGDDGEIYDGASPSQKEVYIERAKTGGDQAGISGRNVFIVVEDDITFVPITDLAGRSKSAQINIIGDAVIEQVAGTDALSFAQLTEMQKLSEETWIALEDMLELDDALDELDNELAAIITSEIDALIQDGAFEEVKGILESEVLVENLSVIAEVTRQVESELGELATEIDYYNACLEKASAATCDSIQQDMDDIGG